MSKLDALGWQPFFADQLSANADLHPARIVVEHRSNYRIRDEHGESSARLAGRLRHQAEHRGDLPAVGDWVLVDRPEHDGEAIIHAVLNRKTKFSRKAAGVETVEQIVAANIDYVWIVSSLDRDFSVRRIERYMTLVWESGAAPIIVLTKADLCPSVDQHLAELDAIAIGTPIHVTSSLTHDGVSELYGYFHANATIALLGSSGVGKSTLINLLVGEDQQATADVRGDGKGRHTTTTRQLIVRPDGGVIIDTPGMREIQLWDVAEGLQATFRDIDDIAHQCRYANCSHQHEPDCAVQAAVQQGDIDAARLESFQKLQKELAYLERKQDVRAQHAEKQKFKAIMKSLKHHPKYKR